MTKDEAIKLAIEAFKSMVSEGWLLHGPEGMDEAQTKCLNAAKAIEEALAKQEQGEPVAWIHEDERIGYRALEWQENALGYRGVWKKIPLYTTPQPKQEQGEPVAKKIAECLAVLRPTLVGKWPHEQALEELVSYTNQRRCENCSSLEKQNTELDSKLAEFEKQKEWVELSEDEWDKVLEDFPHIPDINDFKKIEARLKEMNS